jgi:hypothetical protein
MPACDAGRSNKALSDRRSSYYRSFNRGWHETSRKRIGDDAHIYG